MSDFGRAGPRRALTSEMYADTILRVDRSGFGRAVS